MKRTQVPPMQQGHAPQLDAIRGIAILAVLGIHLGLLPWGWMGVPLFFALSGFLITRQLLDARGNIGALGMFYRRRARRILPLFALFLAVNAALAAAAGRPLPDYGWQLAGLGNLAIGWNEGAAPGRAAHLWSLAVEIQFYALWPLIVLNVHRPALAAAALILAAPVARMLILDGTDNPWLTFVTLPSCLDMLGAGALVACCPDRRLLGAMATAGAGLIAINLAAIPAGAIGHTALWVPHGLTLQTGLGLLFAAIVGTAPRLPAPPRLLVMIGKASYSLYLWHMLAIAAAFALLPDPIAVPGAGALALGAGLLSWRLLERPRPARRPAERLTRAHLTT